MFHDEHPLNGLNFSTLQPTTTAPATANVPKLPQQYFAGVSIRTTSRPGPGACLQAPGHGRNQEGPGETTPRRETNQRQHMTASPHGGACAGGTTCANTRPLAPTGAHAQGARPARGRANANGGRRCGPESGPDRGKTSVFSARAGTAGARCPRRPDTPSQ